MRPVPVAGLASLALAGLLAGCSSSGLVPSPTPVPTVSLRPANPVPAVDLQTAYVSVVKRVGPSVVQIKTDQGLGSGIVLDTRGDIVTNAHVVAGATQAVVTFATGRERPATVVGAFRPDDIAVVRVDPQGLPAPASFGDSSRLEVGDIVMAIGNPLGLRSSVTSGIISAVGRTVSEENGATLPDVIQTSAEINPGNSGGALVDLGGNVVGIPTLAATDPQLGSTAPGIGFAIPSNRVRDIAGQLAASGRVTNSHRAYLGVRLGLGFGGQVIVVSVEPGGPAARGGLAAGDQIIAINGQAIRSPSVLNETLSSLKPGDRVDLGITHEDGGEARITVTLGELPGS